MKYYYRFFTITLGNKALSTDAQMVKIIRQDEDKAWHELQGTEWKPIVCGPDMRYYRHRCYDSLEELLCAVISNPDILEKSKSYLLKVLV